MYSKITNLLKNRLILLLILILGLFAIIGIYLINRNQNNSQAQQYSSKLFDRKAPSDLAEVKAYTEKVKTAVANKEVLNLLELSPEDKDLWDNIKTNPQLVTVLNKEANFRNELFGVYTPKVGDIDTKFRELCKDLGCKRLEIFNFATNNTFYILADIKMKKIVDVQTFVNFQPEIPTYLANLATKISSKDARITEFVGFDLKDSVMGSTKTTLNKSVCERSQHLCVTPTYIMPYKMAIWAIVDLTDMNLVALRWTNLVKDGNDLPNPNTTEKKVANDIIDSKYCQKTNKFEQGDWKMDYTLTSSDGMNFENVTYKGKELIKSTKLVDWHVSYSKDEGFGYSDAIGCPVFSQAAVVAAQEPIIKKGEGYTEFHQEFWSDGWPRPCNYYYEQAIRMYDDGAFRVLATSIGRGCGVDGTYRPVTRIEFGKDVVNVNKYNGTAFEKVQKESQYEAKDLAKNADSFSFKIGNYGVIMPTKGQLDPRERGDDAFVYFSNNTNKSNEGTGDIPTIGGCCNTDLDQGPNKFVNDEPLDKNTVMWYVSQLKNDGGKGTEFCWADTIPNDLGTYDIKEFPCNSGPLFKPLSN